MFTRTDALKAVEEYLNSDPQHDSDLLVLEALTQEYDFGYVFFYDSERHVETQISEYAIGGNAPIIFEKTTGQMLVTGTANPIESYIEAYQNSGDPHSYPSASIKINGWSKGALVISAIKVLRIYDSRLGLAEAKRRLERVLDGSEVVLETSSAKAAREAVQDLIACHFLAEQLYDLY